MIMIVEVIYGSLQTSFDNYCVAHDIVPAPLLRV